MNHSRWSAIGSGAFACLALQISLLLLGIGIGLIVFPFERIGEDWKWIGFGVGSGLYVGLSIAASFFTGGYIASRLHVPAHKAEVCFQGLALWGVASLAGMFLTVTAVSRFLPAPVIGLSAVTMLEKTKPKIVTDLSILKGKAVTTLDLGVSGKALLAQTQTPEAKEAAEVARKATAAMCLAGFLGMLLSSVASVFGAYFGEPSAASVKSLRRARLEAA